MTDDGMIKLLRQINALEAESARMRGFASSSFDLLDSKTAGAGGSASFDFQNIPATYAALKLHLSIRSTKAAIAYDTLHMTQNNLSAANYYRQDSTAHGATAAPSESLGGTYWNMDAANAANAPAGCFAIYDLLFPDYANSNKTPAFSGTLLVMIGTATGNLYSGTIGGFYNVAGALNRLTLSFAADNIAQYSTARLYGIW